MLCALVASQAERLARLETNMQEQSEELGRLHAELQGSEGRATSSQRRGDAAEAEVAALREKQRAAAEECNP